MTRSTNPWAVAGLDIPLPAVRSCETESAQPGRWEKTFEAGQLDDAETAATWDDWARVNKLRTVTAQGPHAMGVARCYDDDDRIITLSSTHMPGEPALVGCYVFQRSALPRFSLVNGHLEAHGLAIPVPRGAVPGVRDDLLADGGEDSYELEAPSFAAADLHVFYAPWAHEQGFTLHDRVGDARTDAVFFRRADGLELNVYADPPRLCIAIKHADDDA